MSAAGPWMNDAARDNLYSYNGKELNTDFGLNWLDYGARWYDASIGRFTAIDRFGEKYPFQAPFAYAANNPISFIDVNGDSIDVYNPQGVLLYTIDDGKKAFTGLFFQNSSTDENGNTTYSEGLSFSYNDPKEDRKSIKEDKFKVQVASIQDIQDMVLKSGAGATNYPYKFALEEGGKDGKLDFFVQNKERIPAQTLSIIQDKNGGSVAYNPKDFGNFMFGLANRFLGIPISHTKLGAHGNNFVNGRRDGNDRWQPLDSKGDQRAIKNGYYFNVKPQNKVYK